MSELFLFDYNQNQIENRNYNSHAACHACLGVEFRFQNLTGKRPDVRAGAHNFPSSSTAPHHLKTNMVLFFTGKGKGKGKGNPTAKKAKRNRAGKARARKQTKSTLGLHTDGTRQDKEMLAAHGFTVELIQSGLHMIDTVLIVGLKQAPPSERPYRKLLNPEQFALRRVNVPAGSLVVWGQYTPHMNENPCCPDPTIQNCEFDVTATSIKELKEKMAIYGVAVFLNVLTEDERQEFIEGMISDLKRSAPPGTPTEKLNPPGGNGCMIVKCYGLGNTLNAQKIRLHQRVRDIFAGWYGVKPEHLTQSADALTWKAPKAPGEEPLRCGQFICWAPAVVMPPGDAATKLRWMKLGKSMCHNPFNPRSGGGPGHMANKREGHPGHWTTLYDPITKEQMQALGCVV